MVHGRYGGCTLSRLARFCDIEATFRRDSTGVAQPPPTAVESGCVHVVLTLASMRPDQLPWTSMSYILLRVGTNLTVGASNHRCGQQFLMAENARSFSDSVGFEKGLRSRTIMVQPSNNFDEVSLSQHEDTHKTNSGSET